MDSAILRAMLSGAVAMLVLMIVVTLARPDPTVESPPTDTPAESEPSTEVPSAGQDGAAVTERTAG